VPFVSAANRRLQRDQGANQVLQFCPPFSYRYCTYLAAVYESATILDNIDISVT
jgi:hypothetical protein